MIMNKRTNVLWMMLTMGLWLVTTACSGQERTVPHDTMGIQPVEIHRFDRALYDLIMRGDTASPQFRTEYGAMLDVTGWAILNVRSSAQEDFWPKLQRYYAEPTLRQLYADALAAFDSIAPIEEALGEGFAFLRHEFPAMTRPAVYMHVSGFNQNVLVADSLLSLSIDKYLGADYSLYQTFFYPDQRRGMSPEYAARDYLRGWLLAEFPFEGNAHVLLERMVYEGKVLALLIDALRLDPRQALGYTEEEMAWCEAHEGQVWKTILETRRLYTPDQMATDPFFEWGLNRPFADQGAPGLLGAWFGLRIVERYRALCPGSYQTLFDEHDAQRILTDSKYKPF